MTGPADDDFLGIARIGEGMIRAGALSMLPDQMRASGLNGEALLRSAGLPRGAFERPETPLPLERLARLVTLCARKSGRPHFALLVGQRARPENYGLLGRQMRHARTLGAAWRGLILNLHLNGRAVVPSLTIDGDDAEIGFALAGEEVEGYQHFLTVALSAACAVMATLAGPRWAPSEVHFSLRPPADRAPYRRFFRAPVHFGSNRTAIVFPASWLERRIQGADPEERRRLEQAIGTALGRQDLALATRVRRALLAQLSRDDVSIDGTARLLGLHKRTLNRRLSEAGTSFARLLGEVRYRIARHLLAETDLSFVDIAATLAYTDASTFSRAFRSWARTTPSAWRQAHAG